MKLTRRSWLSIAGVILAVGLLVWHYWFRPFRTIPPIYYGETHAVVEEKLRPLATAKRKPAPGEWLDRFPEAGQSFQEYTSSNPVRKNGQYRTMYLCLVGSFSKSQEQILESTREYMSLYFQCPVKIHKRLTLDNIPSASQRRQPGQQQLQLLTGYFLYDLLKADCPEDALAYVAFTSADLWTKDSDGRDWNFVFGQADLRNRLGVWSLARFGKPEESPQAYAECLKLTIGTATHETGHILGIRHCVYYECNMNGANHLDEIMSNPLPLCPICLRKLCWNLQVEPLPYLQGLLECSRKLQLIDSVRWYEAAIESLKR